MAKLDIKNQATDIPERFRPSRATLFVDRFMTYAIQTGGVLIVTAVFGIFLFIFSQIWPLFKGASVTEAKSFPIAPGEYRIMGIDEWSELPFVVDTGGDITFFDITGDRPPRVERIELPGDSTLTAAAYRPEKQLLVFGTSDGHFGLVYLKYRRDFTSAGNPVVVEVEPPTFYSFGFEGEITDIAYGDGGAVKLAAAVMQIDGEPRLKAVTLEQKSRGLFGAGGISVGQSYDLTRYMPDGPAKILVDKKAEGILVSTREGKVHYLFRTGTEITERQVFAPFNDLADPSIASMNFLLGDVSIVLTNNGGENRVFNLFAPEGELVRTFGQTKEFPSLGKGATFYSYSLRNKSFLIGNESFASLRYATTESVRWEAPLDFRASLAVLSGKNDRIVILDDQFQLHTMNLRDPHPEASWQAFFGKIWYEGSSEPKFEWQSTGGSDDFEPKLSMVPLVIGTLKGTLYAMMFSLPIALLAAIYTSQFLEPGIKRVVKPTMEVMASLPSVVLGFLAALWLAPLVETRVPSVLLIVIALPVSALAFGYFWSNLPIEYRRHVAHGWEFIAYLPVMAVACYVAWHLGPWLESWAFVVTEADGTRVADFRRWWPSATGAPFEQRNSLVVGFMMGFAVIPIIFTITEDALSNVPNALRSGSLALGASRWQTALRIVLPTASAGIFSAVMIGLGRAVGETMIVVMATGNTPIMDLNIFSGMRTLSANIAVELPEAPHHSTLFRALFLGAMLLFLMTFIVNTAAEILRQHLREKYKTI